MTIQEYYIKYNNLKETNPAPADMDFWDCNAFYRKIIESWQVELSETDRNTVLSREQRFHKKMAS